MILKKIVINDKVMYEPISTIEAMNWENKDELIFSSDDEKKEFEEMLQGYEEAILTINEIELRLKKLDRALDEEKYQSILNKINSIKFMLNKKDDLEYIIDEISTIEDELEDLDDMDDELEDLDDMDDELEDLDDMDDEFKSSKIEFNEKNIILDKFLNKINNIFSNTKKNTNKYDKLLKALPFMKKEDLSELVDDILKNKENYKELDFVAIFPFLNTSDCDRLFMMAVNKKIDCSFITLAPFVSQDILSELVDEYVNGKYEDLEMSHLYPFLKNSDVKKLFSYILKTNS